MTEQEIIKGLIARDNRITEDFFFVKCRPLFYSVMRFVFDYEVDYDEMVNELYVYLMEDDAVKLRNFEYRSSVYQWLKVLAIRFFIKKRHKIVEDASHETTVNTKKAEQVAIDSMTAGGDLERLFKKMNNERYVFVIRRIVLEDQSPEQLALEVNISTANLYNIKRRAIAMLTRVALSEIKAYGK